MKGQMTIPNLLMVICILIYFAVSMQFFYVTIALGLSGVPSTSPEYLIANVIPGALTLTIFSSIIVYVIIRYVSG